MRGFLSSERLGQIAIQIGFSSFEFEITICNFVAVPKGQYLYIIFAVKHEDSRFKRGRCDSPRRAFAFRT